MLTLAVVTLIVAWYFGVSMHLILLALFLTAVCGGVAVIIDLAKWLKRNP